MLRFQKKLGKLSDFYHSNRHITIRQLRDSISQIFDNTFKTQKKRISISRLITREKNQKTQSGTNAVRKKTRFG